MANERVEKGWQKKGIGTYSTEAILGTLGHYGVSVSEDSLRTKMKDLYPMAIAEEWHRSWKGLGQFSLFPLAAVSELFKRWAPDVLLPEQVAQKLGDLLMALAQLIAGSPEAPVGTTLSAFQELKPRIPLQEGEVKVSYVEEIFGYLGESGMKAFEEMTGRLIHDGHLDDAQDFAEIEEFLFPNRRGITTALVRAAQGEKAEAITSLVAIAEDSARVGPSQLFAVDALLELKAAKEAQPLAVRLLDEAEKAEDFHLALALCERLTKMFKEQGDRTSMRALEERFEELVRSHQEAHPGHH